MALIITLSAKLGEQLSLLKLPNMISVHNVYLFTQINICHLHSQNPKYSRTLSVKHKA